jgi:acyl carrier protein
MTPEVPTPELGQANSDLSLVAGGTMKPTNGMAVTYESDVFEVISEAIRSVSPAARQAAIAPSSLLLEELALDSLDLVAVILRLQDHYQVEIDPDEIPEMRHVADLVQSLNKQLRVAA